MPKSNWYDDKVNKKVEKVIESRLTLVGEYVRGQAALLTIKKTGNLSSSINWITQETSGGGKSKLSKPIDNLSVHIGTNLDYAIYVEKGTRPHVIQVKRAKVLTDGKQFFGKKVNHPGTKRKSFLRLGLKLSRNQIRRLLRIQ